MHDVFISYSSVNKDIADAICNRFESGKVKCWYAPRDIRPGEDWPTAIMEAIRQAKIFLLIYSNSSNQSGQVRNEVAAAFDAGCIIVPFRLDLSEMCDELAYYLKRVHWMDAVKPPMTEKIEQLFTTVNRILTTGKGSEIIIGKKPPRRKSGFLKVIALLLVAALVGTSIYGAISRRPQEMKFFCMSHIGLQRYPATLFGMVSADSELLFLRNIETGLWSLVDMTDGYRSLAEFEYAPADPLNTEVFTQKLYDTVYFLEKDRNVVKIYDRAQNAWRNEEGVKLDLSEDEAISTYVYYGENLQSNNDHLEEITMLVYDYQENADCFSKIITITPDSEQAVYDISDLQLTNLICVYDIPDCGYALFMDQSKHVKLVDLESGAMVESDVQKILEEYMPDAVTYDSVLNKRYIHQQEYLEYGTQARVWDLESGNTVFNEKFSWYNLQFSGEHEITYFDLEDCSLYTCDLETGRSVLKLDAKYFEKNSAFLDITYSFYYSEEFETYFFLSQETNGKETKVRLTMTDLDGNILAKSDDIELPFGEHFETISVQDEFVLLTFTPYSLDEVEDGVFTQIYRALYTVDDEGNMVFSEDYN